MIKRKRKLKNITLKSSAAFAMCILIASTVCVDSSSIVPIITLMLSGTYLGLFAKANNWFENITE